MALRQRILELFASGDQRFFRRGIADMMQNIA